jgi:hypothetical protein
MVVQHFLSLPFLLLSLLLLLLVVALLLLLSWLQLFLFLALLVCVDLCLQFCVTTPTKSFLTNLLFRSLYDHPQQEFLLMQEEHPVDQTLSALKAMSWTASLPFKGHFCLKTNIFNASLETEYDLFEYTTSMYRCSKHIIRFSPSLYPITGGFGKYSGGHSLITDLLQAAKSVGNCALISNGYGLRSLTNVTDTALQSEQSILKCINFRKFYF